MPSKQRSIGLAQTDEALLRVLPLICVSIKMHCEGMTVDEATKFFVENCYYEEKARAGRRPSVALLIPEYLYYTLGKLEILKLCDDYQKQEGSGFSLQRFSRRNAAPRRASDSPAPRSDAEGPQKPGIECYNLSS